MISELIIAINALPTQTMLFNYRPGNTTKKPSLNPSTHMTSGYFSSALSSIQDTNHLISDRYEDKKSLRYTLGLLQSHHEISIHYSHTHKLNPILAHQIYRYEVAPTPKTRPTKIHLMIVSWTSIVLISRGHT